MDNENREQPFEEPANVSIETNEERAASEDGSLTAQEEVEDSKAEQSHIDSEDNLGKFKNAQSLLQAYNMLEAEFTKKCQRLSELEKDKKVEETQDLDSALQPFLYSHSEAKNYVEEIKEKLSSSGENSYSQIENAWARVILDHIKASQSMEDELMDKYVLSDQNVKDKIIKEYIREFTKQRKLC